MQFIWHPCHQASELLQLVSFYWAWIGVLPTVRPWLQVVNAASVQSYLKRAFGDQLEVRSCLTCWMRQHS